ncbi:hypothetical protein ABIE26_005322 [Pedobacter africanus]|uniref:Uncharacterized protein n=1 Tax=Pedobacter africanus TaxID=151894 RepID=A0ACC6L4Q9_9SPHI|nr:hypothetical protein [Pedobacter africanus]MDR6786491.1 hypothetical protein [Pedobacter africanus]
MKILKAIVILLLATATFGGCKKEQETQFNIHKPQGYAIIANFDPNGRSPVVFVFPDDQKSGMKMYQLRGEIAGVYTVNGNENELTFASQDATFKFKIAAGKIISSDQVFTKAELIRVPTEDQLAGKTFTGAYYNSQNGAMRYPKFFYAFYPIGNKVNVGIEVGTNLRTETYTPIGNVAAFMKGNGITEFIVKMPDGSIMCNYRDGQGSSYGLFK